MKGNILYKKKVLVQVKVFMKIKTERQMKDYCLLHEITDQTVKNNTSLSCLPEVWILHHSPLEVLIPVRKHDIVSELRDGVCGFIWTITHHLRMELAGTYISEGFGVI